MNITKTEIIQAIVDRFMKAESEPKAHKYHTFKYKCDTCGKNYKGKRGIGIHRAKIHRGQNVPINRV